MTRRRSELEEVAVWEQQDGETSQAYSAFIFYRDTVAPNGRRSIVRAYNRFIGTPDDTKYPQGNWTKWMTVHRWRERAVAWDREVQRLKRVGYLREVEKMGERQARQAETAAQVYLLPVLALAAKLRKDPKLVETLALLSVKDLLRMANFSAPGWAHALRMERLARGQATDTIDLVKNLAKMNEEELEVFISNGLAELDPEPNTPSAFTSEVGDSAEGSTGAGG